MDKLPDHLGQLTGSVPLVLQHALTPPQSARYNCCIWTAHLRLVVASHSASAPRHLVSARCSHAPQWTDLNQTAPSSMIRSFTDCLIFVYAAQRRVIKTTPCPQKTSTFYFFLNNSVNSWSILMILGVWNPEKIWQENLTECPPRLPDVATVPLEIQKSHFQQYYSYILLIISQENNL